MQQGARGAAKGKLTQARASEGPRHHKVRLMPFIGVDQQIEDIALWQGINVYRQAMRGIVIGQPGQIGRHITDRRTGDNDF